MFTKYHPYIVNAGKTLNWVPSDTEELYHENLKKQRNLLEKYNWISTEVHYKFNSEGFRGEEFSIGGAMFLGCSYTFGIGLPKEHTFPHLVSSELSLPCVNLGLPASSADTAFRLACVWIDSLQPKLVVYLSPFKSRFELLIHDYRSNEVESRFITTMDQLLNFNNDPTWLKTEQNMLVNAEKNKLAIEKLCDDRNIQFVHEDVDSLITEDLARDLLHPGIESHNKFSQKLLKNLV